MGGIAAAMAVRDRIGDGVAAVVVGIRRIGQLAVRADAHRAVQRGGGGDMQGVAIDIGVVRQHVDGGGGVLVGRGGVVMRIRRIVHRADADIDDGRVLMAMAVVDGVADFVGAVVVRVGGIGQLAVRADGHRAVLGGGRNHRQLVAIGIAVVGQHVDQLGGVLGGRGAVVHRMRGRIVRCAARTPEIVKRHVPVPYAGAAHHAGPSHHLPRGPSRSAGSAGLPALAGRDRVRLTSGAIGATATAWDAGVPDAPRSGPRRRLAGYRPALRQGPTRCIHDKPSRTSSPHSVVRP